MVQIRKFDTLLVNLNPTKGSEQSGIRPCVVIQNDYANKYAKTFVVSIISSVIKNYPHTFIINSSEENGLKTRSRIDFLQTRTVDQGRIIKKLGFLNYELREEFNMKIKVAFAVVD